VIILLEDHPVGHRGKHS